MLKSGIEKNKKNLFLLQALPDVYWSAQPVVLGALLTTLINDRVLKGSSFVPASLTGKLSDFAGLFFTPFTLLDLVCLLFPSVRRHPRIQTFLFFILAFSTYLVFSL